ADGQAFDRVDQFTDGTQGQELHRAREQRLIDGHDRAVLPVDGAHTPMMPLSEVAVSVRGMTIQMGGVTIDCADPHKLAEFWTEALGTSVGADYGEYIFLNPTAEGGPFFGLQRVPEERAGKNRVHVDFRTDDRTAEVERLVKLGATAVAEHSVPGLSWTVLRDPEGNEFCVGSEG